MLRSPALVLLVSPDRLTREVIAGWLGFSGYRVQAAASTAAALATTPGAQVRVAIVDLEYSCDALVSTVETIRNSLPDVPLIALTGRASDADMLGSSRRLGPVARLQKHGSLHSLRETVEDCLRRH